MDGDRDGDVQVIPLATEDWMGFHADGHVKVAVLAAVAAAVALPRNPNPRAVGQPGRCAQRQRFAARLDLLSGTARAARLPKPPRAVAVRAWLREHHVAARRLHDAAALTVRTARLHHLHPA